MKIFSDKSDPKGLLNRLNKLLWQRLCGGAVLRARGLSRAASVTAWLWGGGVDFVEVVAAGRV